MAEIEIIVMGRTEAGEVLSSLQLAAEIQYLISIGDPEAAHPAGFANVAERLRLLFRDTTDETGPTDEDVRQIIDLAERIAGRTGKILAHCESGISRSSAAAFIVYAVILGSGREVEALQRVITQRPVAIPNRRMVEIADKLLQRKGALLRALDSLNPTRPLLPR